jgi:GNAT superfamily N-acetyltransferase
LLARGNGVLYELSSPSFATRPLTDDDAIELQALLEECADYFHVVLDRGPGPAEALGVFYAGPEEGKSPDNKILLGIMSPTSPDLIGVLDAFVDYPEKGVWYVGLMLFVPRARRSGLGAQVIEELVAVAQRAGARELQLNVVEQNELAHAFWSRHGFVERRRWLQRFGDRQSIFIRMARPLS